MLSLTDLHQKRVPQPRGDTSITRMSDSFEKRGEGGGLVLSFVGTAGKHTRLKMGRQSTAPLTSDDSFVYRKVLAHTQTPTMVPFDHSHRLEKESTRNVLEHQLFVVRTKRSTRDLIQNIWSISSVTGLNF